MLVFFQNECSFVSLRDVERAMKVIAWFYSNSELLNRTIGNANSFGEFDIRLEESDEDESYEIDEEVFSSLFLKINRAKKEDEATVR